MYDMNILESSYQITEYVICIVKIIIILLLLQSRWRINFGKNGLSTKKSILQI